MSTERFIDIEDFGKGLVVLEDSTKSPKGSARVMNNMLITDRGGIGKRPGTLLLGTLNTNAQPIKGVFTFVKSFGSQEWMLKGYDDELEFYHSTAGWTRLKNGFTVGSEFGFKEHLVNTDNNDFVYFCNRTEDYQRWQGSVTTLATTLAGAETTITTATDGVLKPDVYDAATATASSATTLDVASRWTASQWNSFYVKITSGVHSGKIRLITATTSTRITFDTLGSDPSTPTFEIRQANFPATGTIIYNGTTIAYTAIPEHNQFTVGSAHAATAGVAITIVPTTYPANPRGNRLETHYTRMIVGNVRSALGYTSGGTLQGSASEGSYFVSKIKNATDFTFTATRIAGEGDIASTPYGGGPINDVANQEDTFYVFKRNYIEAAKYTQDSNDIIQRQQLKTGFGAVGRVIKGKDDIFFSTVDKQLTSIGRLAYRDTTPQSVNFGLPIKRLLDTMDNTDFSGAEYRNRILMNFRAEDTDTYNNRVLVYNQTTKSFEGLWSVSSSGFTTYLGDLYYAQSSGANVFKMFTGTSDVQGTDIFPISSEWLSNYMNLTASDFNLQSVNAMSVEGYIKGDTTITLSIYKDFSDTAALTYDFGGTETQFQDADNLAAFLGSNPLGLQPLGALSDPDIDGRRHFSFIVYFPDIYGNHFSIGVANEGKNQDFEITRFALNFTQDLLFKGSRIKTI